MVFSSLQHLTATLPAGTVGLLGGIMFPLVISTMNVVGLLVDFMNVATLVVGAIFFITAMTILNWRRIRRSHPWIQLAASTVAEEGMFLLEQIHTFRYGVLVQAIWTISLMVMDGGRGVLVVSIYAATLAACWGAARYNDSAI